VGRRGRGQRGNGILRSLAISLLRLSGNVPGIRVHTDIEAMMWALEEFFLSMLGVNIAVGAHAAWPGAFPQRMLVIDPSIAVRVYAHVIRCKVRPACRLLSFT
jgi:hypothetical protein